MLEIKAMILSTYIGHVQTRLQEGGRDERNMHEWMRAEQIMHEGEREGLQSWELWDYGAEPSGEQQRLWKTKRGKNRGRRWHMQRDKWKYPCIRVTALCLLDSCGDLWVIWVVGLQSVDWHWTSAECWLGGSAEMSCWSARDRIPLTYGSLPSSSSFYYCPLPGSLPRNMPLVIKLYNS